MSPEDKAVIEAADTLETFLSYLKPGSTVHPESVSVQVLRWSVQARRAALQPKPRYHHHSRADMSAIVDSSTGVTLSADDVLSLLNQAEESGRTGPRSGSVEQKGSQP